MSECEFYQKYYDQLLGCKIVKVLMDDEDGEIWPVLIAETQKGEKLEMVVMRDPEGNGPGFIDGLPHPKS